MEAVEQAMVFLVAIGAALALSKAEIHTVGESDGWTIGNVSYGSWAASKTFHVGDTIVFEYNKQFHNVVEVSRANYRSCNATSPIATHTSGNDSIPIKRKGHYFFICGFTGHCGLGQKVDIRVVDNHSLAPASSSSKPLQSVTPSLPSTPSSPSAPSTPSSTAGAPLGPNTNYAPSMVVLSFLGWAIGAITSILVI